MLFRSRWSFKGSGPIGTKPWWNLFHRSTTSSWVEMDPENPTSSTPFNSSSPMNFPICAKNSARCVSRNPGSGLGFHLVNGNRRFSSLLLLNNDSLLLRRFYTKEQALVSFQPSWKSFLTIPTIAFPSTKVKSGSMQSYPFLWLIIFRRVPIIDVSCGVAGVARVAGKVNKQKT